MIHDSAASTVFLNDDLLRISRWAYLWKMIFNPDASKQAQEIVFSRKVNASNHATVYSNSAPVIRDNIQKHLGLFLDSKRSFFDHINEKIKNATKGVNVNSRLSDKIESVQYDAALAITGAIRGTSKEKLYQELGLESLKDRRWLR